MALGGGTYVSQNKKLPGTYINFIGRKKASGALSDRGVAAVALTLNWGALGTITKVTRNDISKNCVKLFGVSYSSESMMPLRELFCHANEVLVYRLGTGGTAAGNTYADAKYVGTDGNSIITVITATTDGDKQTGWNVQTWFGSEMVDEQTVSGASAKTDALEDNDYVTWKPDVSLTAATKTTGALSGGENPTAATSHGTFLNALQNESFNVVACSSTTSTIVAEYTAFIKDMRENLGVKCQAVVYNSTANYEGVISEINAADLVYWLAGAEAGCAVNESCTNMTYDGELTFKVNYTQTELESALDVGHIIFHKIGDEVRVLEDVNTLTSFTETKTEDFKYNQTIRVLDQIANDITSIYNTRYIGKIPNDASGRASLWNDIVSICNTLLDMRAIENFSSEDVEVLAGDTKKSVVANLAVTPVSAMAQLYVSVYVN